MKNIFEIKKLETELKNWTEIANKHINHFQQVYTANESEILNLNMKILDSFTYAFYKRIPSDEREMLLNAVTDGELSKSIAKKFELADAMPKYGPMNPFAALRIYHRKITALVRETAEIKSVVRDLFKELKEIDLKAREFEAAGVQSGILFNIQMNILAFQQSVKEILELKTNANRIDFMIYVRALIEGQKTIKREDFLQVITLNKDLRHWGEPVKPFSKVFSEIPEEISWEEFQNLIFVENIERPGEEYLADLFMEHVFMVREQYEAATGEKAFDAFEILEEITGKPMQTYTAKFDEYGDVISLTPNKPNLKVVEGGVHEQ